LSATAASMNSSDRLPICDVMYHASTTSAGLPSDEKYVDPLSRFSKKLFSKYAPSSFGTDSQDQPLVMFFVQASICELMILPKPPVR
jgi:hypothetical protein